MSPLQIRCAASLSEPPLRYTINRLIAGAPVRWRNFLGGIAVYGCRAAQRFSAQCEAKDVRSTCFFSPEARLFFGAPFLLSPYVGTRENVSRT